MTEQQAVKIVDALLDDLSGRSALGNEWEQCDAEVQQELKNSWVEIVLKMERAGSR